MKSRLHPKALVITILLWQAKHRFGLEESAYTIVETYFEEWADEMKADLYARMAENVKEHMLFDQAVRAVSACLWSNEVVFNG